MKDMYGPSSEKKCVYISASIINAVNNQYIANCLAEVGFEVALPQTLAPVDIAHETFPRKIFEGCLQMMEKSYAGLIMLDSYERDSSWECGWYFARNKPLIGYVESSCKFLQDWMIKGGLNAVITPSSRIFQVLLEDTILKHKVLKKIPSVNEIGHSLESVLQSLGRCCLP